MRIIAVDPGAVATGVAAIYSHAESWVAKQFTDPLAAWDAVEEELDNHGEVVLLIEDYNTSTQLTKEAKATIGLVRFFELTAKHYHAYNTTVLVKSPQFRLSGQREAAELMGGTIEELKRDPSRKDAFSALSHCLVYRRTVR